MHTHLPILLLSLLLMDPVVAFIAGVFAGAIGVVLAATMGMKRARETSDDEEMPEKGPQPVELRSATEAQQHDPHGVALRPAETVQRLAKSWNLIWVWIYDSEHPLHSDGIDPESRSGDYYLRPVIAPEDILPEHGTILTYKYSGLRKCYLLDSQYQRLTDIEEKKGNEMSTWYELQRTREHASEGPGQDGTWPNLSEMIDGIDLESRNTQGGVSATPKIFPQPPRRVVKLEQREQHSL